MKPVLSRADRTRTRDWRVRLPADADVPEPRAVPVGPAALAERHEGPGCGDAASGADEERRLPARVLPGRAPHLAVLSRDDPVRERRRPRVRVVGDDRQAQVALRRPARAQVPVEKRGPLLDLAELGAIDLLVIKADGAVLRRRFLPGRRRVVGIRGAGWEKQQRGGHRRRRPERWHGTSVVPARGQSRPPTPSTAANTSTPSSPTSTLAAPRATSSSRCALVSIDAMPRLNTSRSS